MHGNYRLVARAGFGLSHICKLPEFVTQPAPTGFLIFLC